MVARLNGVQEAAGSNPVTRTKNPRFRKKSGIFLAQKFCLFCADWNLTGMRIVSAKRRIECLHGLLFYRALHMQIMLRHVQIRMAHHALDGRQVYAQRL